MYEYDYYDFPDLQEELEEWEEEFDRRDIYRKCMQPPLRQACGLPPPLKGRLWGTVCVRGPPGGGDVDSHINKLKSVSYWGYGTRIGFNKKPRSGKGNLAGVNKGRSERRAVVRGCDMCLEGSGWRPLRQPYG